MALLVLAIWSAVVVQIAIAYRLTSGSIGFDKAGTSGLDYPMTLQLAAVYVLFLCFGALASLINKRWIALGVQAVLTIALVIYFAI